MNPPVGTPTGRTCRNRGRPEDVDPERYAVAVDFDARKDELPDGERVAVEFARKSVQAPDEVTDEDVDRLREHGYDTPILSH